jgi:REP element-mobilizing transposase RayT
MDFGSAAESDQPDAALKSPEEDPRIAQIALSLTQVSLELTAEATLLTRHGEIVAVEGQLTPADIAELRDVAGRSNIGEDDARISFITLNSNNRSYMLYSRRSIGDFILSMVFAADTPLRDIRRQGKRLAEALEAVPEVPLSLAELQLSSAATALPDTAPEAPATLAPYAFVWLLRDPNHTLSIAAAGAIMAGLRMQLGEMGWHINRLQAQDEYVYLLADIPDNRPAYEMIRELKRRSAEIVHTQDAALSPATMWADSYLVMTPGRELQPDEINQFINFERML